MSTEHEKYFSNADVLATFEGVNPDTELDRWAAERGWRVGPPQGGSPRGLSVRAHVAKWRSLTETDRRSLDAIAERVGRRLVVYAPVAAVAPVRSRGPVSQLGLFGGGRAA